MAKLNKSTVETIKTVVIAVLVSSIVAFIAGNVYANKQNGKLEAARVQAVATQPAKK